MKVRGGGGSMYTSRLGDVGDVEWWGLGRAGGVSGRARGVFRVEIGGVFC